MGIVISQSFNGIHSSELACKRFHVFKVLLCIRHSCIPGISWYAWKLVHSTQQTVCWFPIRVPLPVVVYIFVHVNNCITYLTTYHS